MKENNIIDFGAVETKEFVRLALANHYGEERQMPEVLDKLRIKRHDFFERKHLGAEKVIEFFDKPSAFPLGNFADVNLPDNKFFIILGIKFKTSAGLVGAAANTLDFDTMAETAIQTGVLNLSVNDEKHLENQNIQNLFEPSTPVITDFLQLPQPIVIEPNNKVDCSLKMFAAAGDFWAEVSLVGLILEK